MTYPGTLAAGLRAHARGLRCLRAAAELLISQDWLHRPEFTRFITVHHPVGSGPALAVVDWPAVIGALGSRLACSGGERRMLKITASLAHGIPVDLQEAVTGLDHRNTSLLLAAIDHASGNRPPTWETHDTP